ncbi:MAG: hypothetical protein K2J32_06665 [Ruminococcus sp.]|nr:hypothetical protein [Ruminococcus sp.]
MYDRINTSEIYRIVDETPFIFDLRKHFYKQMLTYRKELILDKSFEILNELDEVKNNHDFYYSRHKDKINHSTAKKHKKKGSCYPDLD